MYFDQKSNFASDEFEFDFANKTIKLKYIYYWYDSNHSTILFFHANGFSSQTYNKILKFFYEQSYNIFGLNFAGHDGSENYSNFRNWFFFRDQVLSFANFLRSKTGISKFHLIGHSLGGASSLLAASLDKEHIISVVCWDPVVFTPFFSFLTLFIEPPIAKTTEKRRDEFPNVEVLKRSLKLLPLFKNWDKEVLQDYVDSCFYFDEFSKKYKLSLPKDIEAKIFRSLKFGHWKFYKKITQPVFVLTPKTSFVCPPRARRLLTRNHPISKSEIHPIDSHFFPMIQPIQTAEITLRFLKQIENSKL
ncbi:MAG: alpha/beta hydrolase [Leptospiraceae bacterium]|nr:alpha/beta hydrolase [Leptospiraceae bacterium]MDW7976013.1 alpha/beta hydrolase [Leptospiraceae bacterium]